ncbi:helix-turn-helix transcriptional regulator [Streptomyces sp. NPDC047023]|uniref:helix-turn-helix domain-containing protein n=1 Tax=Streptomyces sp. NPDC047023 TaxID=3155139 RepID=UPI0033C8CEB5
MNGPEAAYAAGLVKATDKYFNSSANMTPAPAGAVGARGTQAAMAEGMGISPSVLSRWLSGKRVAPLAGLHAIKAFLEAQSVTFADRFWDELDELCGQAVFTSGTTADRLAYLEAKLPGLLAAYRRTETRAQTAEEAQQRAETRAQTAEDACLVLQAKVAERDQSLLKAQCYIRNTDTDLAQEKMRGDRLQTKCDVQSEQIRRLLAEKHAPPAPSTWPTMPYPVHPLAYAEAASRLRTTLLVPPAIPGYGYPGAAPFGHGEPIPQHGPTGYYPAPPRQPGHGRVGLTALGLREVQQGVAAGLHGAKSCNTGPADLHYARAALLIRDRERRAADPARVADGEPAPPAPTVRRADAVELPLELLPGHTALASRLEPTLPSGAAGSASLLWAALLWVASVLFGKLTGPARR